MQLETQISIHAPARGATVKELCEIVWGEFQSTLPRGERRVFLCHVTDNRSISIHAPASGATLEVVEVVRRRVFQSTLPRVERRATSTWSCCRRVFQSTLPRVERRGKIYVVCSRGAISIHAPASGATVIFPLSSCSVTFQSTLPRVERRVMEVYRNKYVAISIHAPASGATIRMEDEMSVMENFNPRSREWSDHSTHPEGYRLSQISIHAPASGATSSQRLFSRDTIFQSTLPRVERPRRRLLLFLFSQFQSTLPRVERHASMCTATWF